jgi:hypothetical protein
MPKQSRRYVQPPFLRLPKIEMRLLGLWVDEHWYKAEMNKRLANVLKVADGWIEKLDVTDEQKQWIRTDARSI